MLTAVLMIVIVSIPFDSYDNNGENYALLTAMDIFSYERIKENLRSTVLFLIM